MCDEIRQWFSAGGELNPWGALGNDRARFWSSRLGYGCCWSLVGGPQGLLPNALRHAGQAHSDDPAPDVSARAEKP